MRALVAITDLERFEGKRGESKLISSSITLKSVATASLIRSHVNRLARKQRSSLQIKGLESGLLVVNRVLRKHVPGRRPQKERGVGGRRDEPESSMCLY